MKFGRCLVIAGGVILIVGGLLHSYGYHLVEPRLVSCLNTEPQLVGVFKTLWLAFGVEFVGLGLIAIWGARVLVGRVVILLCALIAGLSSVLMFHYIGAFIGSEMNALASICVFVGALLMPRMKDSHPASRMW
jgi:hypothetical protein